MGVRSLLVVLFLTAASLVLGGCNAEQFGQLQAQAIQAKADIAAVKTEISKSQELVQRFKEQAATQPAGPERDRVEAVVNKLETGIEKTNKWLTVAEAAADQLDAKLKAANPSDKLAAVEAVATSAAGAVPGYGPLIAMALTAVFGWARAAQNRIAARAIAKSLETVQKPDGTINLDDETTQQDLRMHQGAVAGRIVDEAQGKAVKLLV